MKSHPVPIVIGIKDGIFLCLLIMKIAKRFYYYLIGFGIGLILTLIIFKGRGCEWLPNERVLTSIRNSSIFITSKNACIMEKANISKEDIFTLLESGDINFGESQTKSITKPYYLKNVMYDRSNSKTYIIELDKLKISFDLYEQDSIVFVNQFLSYKNDNSCSGLDTTNPNALYMPNEMTLEKLRSNKLKYESTFNCEMECNKLLTSDIDSALANGEVLFDFSYPKRKPNPLYFIKYKKGNADFIIWVELGSTKTRLKRVVDASFVEYEKNDFLIDKVFSLNEEPNGCDCIK